MRLDTEVEEARNGVYHSTMRAQHHVFHPRSFPAKLENSSDPDDARRALDHVSQQRSLSSGAKHCGSQEPNTLWPDYAATLVDPDDPPSVSALNLYYLLQ